MDELFFGLAALALLAISAGLAFDAWTHYGFAGGVIGAPIVGMALLLCFKIGTGALKRFRGK